MTRTKRFVQRSPLKIYRLPTGHAPRKIAIGKISKHAKAKRKSEA